MRQLTRSEAEVRRTAPGRGGRPARVPRAVPQGRRTRPVRATPAASPSGRAVTSPAPAAARQSRPPRAPFVLLVVGLLCGGLVSLLLLNTVLAQDSFRANELRNANNQLRQKKEALKHDNMRREMPASLSESALVQNQRPDWDKAYVLTPDRVPGAAVADPVTLGRSADSRSADGDRTSAGQERVPGTGR